MQIAAMDDGIGILKPFAKSFIQGDLTDLIATHRIHKAQIVHINGHAAGCVTNPQIIKGMKGIRAKLDACPDFPQFGGPFQDQGWNAFLRQAAGQGQATDTATCDQNARCFCHVAFLPERVDCYSASGCAPGCAAVKAGWLSICVWMARKRGISDRSTLKRAAENNCGARQISARPGVSPKQNRVSG